MWILIKTTYIPSCLRILQLLEVENIMCSYGNLPFSLLEFSHKEQKLIKRIFWKISQNCAVKSNISLIKLFLPWMSRFKSSKILEGWRWSRYTKLEMIYNCMYTYIFTWIVLGINCVYSIFYIVSQYRVYYFTLWKLGIKAECWQLGMITNQVLIKVNQNGSIWFDGKHNPSWT